MIEDGGVSSRVGLVKTNKFPRDKCHREDCILCLQTVGGSQVSGCELNSVSYEGQCLRCQEKQVYVGETSRAAYTRINEDMSNYRVLLLLVENVKKTRTNLRDVKKHNYILTFQEPTALIIRDT